MCITPIRRLVSSADFQLSRRAFVSSQSVSVCAVIGAFAERRMLSTLAHGGRWPILKSMKLVVQGVGLSVSASLRKYLEEKLVRPVEKLLARHPAYGASVLTIELVHGTRHHKKGKVWEAIASLRLPGGRFWKKIAAEDMRAAIDELEAVLRREITQYKERSRSRFMRGARQAKKELRLARSARLYRKGRIRQEGW